MAEPTPSFRPNRKWGQNFLVNAGACEAIVRAFAPQPSDLVLEIGPGRGALTALLAGRVGRLVAVEIDPRLAADLRSRLGDRLEVVEDDVLEVDLEALLGRLGTTGDRPARVIANLPYNIATAVILRFLAIGGRVSDLLVMVQREVAERIASPPRRKSYGSLSVLCQTYAKVDLVLRLGPGSFRPRPKVDSQVIRLVPRDPGRTAGSRPEEFAALVRAAFEQRRKTLLNNLARLPIGHVAARGAIERAGLNPGGRAEEVSPQGFQALADAIIRA